MSVQFLLIILFHFFYAGHSGEHHTCDHHIDIVPIEDILDDDRIEWTEGHRLTWDDFQAVVPYRQRWTRNIAAITSSVIQYRYSCENGMLKYDIKSIFLPDESWVKDNARTEDYLMHEQLHFDITELFARKLRNRLMGKTFACDEVQKFENEIQITLDEWQKLQKKYDYETAYSLDYFEQSQWNDYVKRLLNVYQQNAK